MLFSETVQRQSWASTRNWGNLSESYDGVQSVARDAAGVSSISDDSHVATFTPTGAPAKTELNILLKWQETLPQVINTVK